MPAKKKTTAAPAKTESGELSLIRKLAEILNAVTPDSLDCFFFSNSGAEATEGAVGAAIEMDQRAVLRDKRAHPRLQHRTDGEPVEGDRRGPFEAGGRFCTRAVLRGALGACGNPVCCVRNGFADDRTAVEANPAADGHQRYHHQRGDSAGNQPEGDDDLSHILLVMSFTRS